MSTELTIALIGAITTILGTVLGNIQGKRKSNAEAGLMQVQTLEEIRKFYETTITSQSNIVASRDKRITDLENELSVFKQKVNMLEQAISRLLNGTCIEDCDEKATFSKQEIADMLDFDKYLREKNKETDVLMKDE